MKDSFVPATAGSFVIRHSHPYPALRSLRRVRFLSLLFILLWLGKFCALAQDTIDEDKRKAFLKAKEEMKTLPMTPAPETNPKPKPKPFHGSPSPSPTPKATPTPPPPSKPVPPEATPKPHAETPQKPRGKSEPEATPQPKPEPPPPTHPSTPSTLVLPFKPTVTAPVVIEKQGFEEHREFQPAPPAGWFEHWKYLSKSVRAEIDRAPVASRRWRYIVVHNSGTRQGNARAFDYYHRYVRKMPNGLAYHFVIGNGTSTGDGQIEIGDRWRRQINGGHVHSDYLNNIALGICLVGDFNRDQPTHSQLEACEELIRYLRQRVGKIDSKWAIVKPHREINPPRWPTDCPGDHFPYNWIHSRFYQPGT